MRSGTTRLFEAEMTPWNASVEKLHFEVDSAHPIQVIEHLFKTTQRSRYDMHYGSELGIVLDGTMERYYQGHTLSLASGDNWLCGTWEPHGWSVTAAPCHAVVLIVHPPMLAGVHFEEIGNNDWFSIFSETPANRPQVSENNRGDLLAIGRSLANPRFGNAEAHAAWVHLKLLEVLLILHEGWSAADPRDVAPPAPPDERMEAVIDAVLASRRFFPVDEAARICGMNRNSFSAAFKRVMGISFPEFALRYRVSCAARSLATSDEPVKRTAANWGFTDASHLHRCFRKYLLTSPRDYRRSGAGISRKVNPSD